MMFGWAAFYPPSYEPGHDGFAEQNRYNRNKGTGGLQWNTR